MVNPVTLGKQRSTFTSREVEYVKGYRQRRPYTLPLDYEHNIARAAFGNPNDYQYPAILWQVTHLELLGAIEADVYNKAYGRLIEKLGDAADLGITLAQWRQSDDMIRNRANQLGAFTGALVRRNPAGIAASLGLSLRDVQRVMRTRYGVARSLSDLWLEFWFGWKPLVTDIYKACEVFDRDIPNATYSGSASLPLSFRSAPEGTPYGTYFSGEGRHSIRVQIDVRLVNPNVHLLNQFGLLNPAVVAWDAIPWSFVVDWFANVSAYLGSITDFAGLATSRGQITQKSFLYGSNIAKGRSVDNSGFVTYYTWTCTGSSRRFKRSVGLPSLPRPALRWKDLSMSPSRGLTAIGLLVQKLPSR